MSATLTDFLAQVPNPFAAAVVSEHDIATGAAQLPDVPSIHGEARTALSHALSRARAGRPHIQLITGEKGDGKSHLCAWLRRQEGDDFVFVSVPPSGQPATAERDRRAAL
jgi:hypothetical protein